MINCPLGNNKTLIIGAWCRYYGTVVRGSVVAICADNPAAAALGGFKESFFAERPCCHCMVSKEENVSDGT